MYKSTYQQIEDILGRRFTIKTINAAVTDRNKSSIIGPDTIQYNINGTIEEQETATVRVEARVSLSKLLQVYQSGFEMSLSGKDKLPEFIGCLEDLITMLGRVKSYNSNMNDIKVGNTGVTLREVVNLYLTMVKSNQKLVNKLLFKELTNAMNNNGILVLGGGINAPINSNIKTGEAFIEEALNINNNITTSGRSRKFEIERLRDEY